MNTTKQIQPQLSVIVPVYNAEKYIHNCIDSILRQTFHNFELLLIDDGSTDRSGQICDTYAKTDYRITATHIPNSGPGAARNAGISKARAEWICFIDSDDEIEAGYIETFFCQGIPKKECLTLQGLQYVNRNTGLTQKCITFPDVTLQGKELSTGIATYSILHSGFPVAKLYNGNIIKDNQLYFCENISYHEDHLFFFRYLRYVNCIQLIKASKYKYMITDSSLTGQIHPYEKVEIAYQALKKELSGIIDNFGITNHSYLNSIHNFICKIHIRAIVFCYRINTAKSKRRQLLSNSLAEQEYLTRYYTPDNIKEKLLKFTLLNLPVKSQDLFLKLLFTLR